MSWVCWESRTVSRAFPPRPFTQPMHCPGIQQHPRDRVEALTESGEGHLSLRPGWVMTSVATGLSSQAEVTVCPCSQDSRPQPRRQATQERSCNLYFVNKSCLIPPNGILQRGRSLSRDLQRGERMRAGLASTWKWWLKGSFRAASLLCAQPGTRLGSHSLIRPAFSG